MKSRQYIGFSILFLFILSALIMHKQLMVPGYFCVHAEDTYAFTSRGWQFVEALKEGIIYPRWAHLNFWGYGSPAFLLYPPLGYYFTAFFSMFTSSVITAMNITKFVALFLSGVGMFYLVREFFSERIALLTAAFYIVYPYNVFQFYLVGTFYATISLMWFAPIILFTYRYMNERHFKNVIYAGLCYGGLILTHVINAYMFTFILVAFIVYMSLVRGKPKGIILIPLIIITGILISSAYTLPIIFEKQFVHLKEFVGEGSGRGFLFDFRNFFILPNMTSMFSPNHVWHRLYNVYLFHVVLLGVLIILSLSQTIKLKNIKTKRNAYDVNNFFIGTGLFSIFLLFGLSTFVWEIVPFFKYVQFSHRWLNITTFAAVILVSVVFWGIGNIHKTKKERAALLVILFFICIIIFSLDYKYIRLAPAISEHELIPIKPPNWYKVDLPASVDIDAINKNFKSQETVVITSGEGEVILSKWGSAERAIEITAYVPLAMRIKTFNFPGWNAYVDDMHVAIQTERGSGAILIDIPRGNHKLVLRFEDTPIRYYSKLLSLVSLVSVVVLLLFSKRKKRNKSSQI